MVKQGAKKRDFLFSQVFKSQGTEMETEKCVSCGCDTEVPILQPIEEREYYVHGCGQLCQACYDEFEVEWYKQE